MDTIGKILLSILMGSVAGITAGGVLAWFTSNQQKERDSLQRDEQIKFFSELIVKSRKMIFDVKEDRFFPEPNRTISVDDMCKAYLDNLRRQLESALSGRANRLTFDEIEKIKIIFQIGIYNLFPTARPNKEYCASIFQEAESLKCLKIPPMPRNNGR